jgi:hypothetical protein
VKNPIRLRVQRSKKVDCPRDLNSTVQLCYSSSLTGDNVYKQPITVSRSDANGNSEEVVYKYMSEKETKISRDTSGVFADYDGTGYVIDFDPMLRTSDWYRMLDDLEAANYFSVDIRAVHISFTLFIPSTSYWVA